MSYLKIKEMGEKLGGADKLTKMGETGLHFVPYEVQLMWFKETFPNGRIVTEAPDVDPLRTAGTYICRAEVYLDREEAVPAAVAFAKKGPKDEIDPYLDVQRSARSRALFDLGFNKMTLGIFGEEEDHSLLKEKATDAPAAVPMENPEITAKENSVVISEEKEEDAILSLPEKQVLEGEEVKPKEEKRGRKKKEKAEDKAEEVKEFSPEAPTESDFAEEKASLFDNPALEPAEEIIPLAEPQEEKAVENKEDDSVSEESSLIEDAKKEEDATQLSLEEEPETEDLLSMEFEHNGRVLSIADILDSGERKDGLLLYWIASSKKGKTSYPKIGEAISLLEKRGVIEILPSANSIKRK